MANERVTYYSIPHGVEVKQEGVTIYTIMKEADGKWQLYDPNDQKVGFAYEKITKIMDRFNRNYQRS